MPLWETIPLNYNWHQKNVTIDGVLLVVPAAIDDLQRRIASENAGEERMQLLGELRYRQVDLRGLMKAGEIL